MKLQEWPERLGGKLGGFRALEFLRGYFLASAGLCELVI